jgi:hypothetical protein
MSDLNDAVETTESPVDRKELLSQQFNEVEENAPVDRPRDEAGKYAKAEKAAPKAAEAPSDAEPPVWRRPPASWKKDYHEPWNTVDDKIKEYVWQREEQMRKGVEPLLSKAQFADAMQTAIEPFLPTIRGMGLEPQDAVKALMQADYTLRNSPADQKLAYFHQLAAQYGINLGQGMPEQQQTMDPRLFALQNELNNVRGEVLTWKQQQEAAQNQSLMGEIHQFSQTAEHFEEARPIMISLLQTGQANTLQEAYEKAIWSNPEIRQQLIEAQQAEKMAKLSDQKNRAAKAARAAAVSVRSSTPGTNTAPKANDRRSMLAEQFDSMNDRL